MLGSKRKKPIAESICNAVAPYLKVLVEDDLLIYGTK